MAEGRRPFEQWWHNRTTGIGLANAFDARSVRRVESAYHEIEILEHCSLGWMLAIDGALQCVERDSGDREMFIHVPLLGKERRACRVLLLGADAVKLHELLVHSFVSEVVVCERDKRLVEIWTDYLGFGDDFRDRRVSLRELGPEEALSYSGEHAAPFDLIVLAWPENAVPRTELGRSDAFCDGLHRCLGEGGVCVDSDRVVLGVNSQRWYRDAPGASPSLLQQIVSRGKLNVQFYHTLSQLSEGGIIGYFLYSRDRNRYSEPRRDYRGKFYNPGLHRAAFMLPAFWPELTEGDLRGR